MRVALVHDYLNQYGGAERVLESFCQLFPRAPVFTLFYSPAATGHAFDGRDIRTSFLQHIPLLRNHHRYFPLLMPMAIESFDFFNYDLVLSSSASYGKGIITGPNTIHICYCHTPTRYAWSDVARLKEDFSYASIFKPFVPLGMSYIRIWDKQSAARPDVFLANSHFVQRRIKKYYGREARVVHPPVNFNSFSLKDASDYFLLVGRFVPYKRFDIAVRAFSRLGLKLKIIGDGPERKRLQKIAGPTVEFLGLVSETHLPEYYGRARALIFPQEEDFGISALESMAAGRPVIAYRGGGALEYVNEGETGIFFDRQTPEDLIEAIHRFDGMNVRPAHIRESVRIYDKEHFLSNMAEIIQDILMKKSEARLYDFSFAKNRS